MTNKWYSNGLRFQCTGCGKCCGGYPGYVWVSHEEMEKISSFLKISLQEFSRKYIRRVGNRYSLIERKHNYECIFLHQKKCSIYEARPIQCKTYPFWPQNLNSKENWEAEAKTCEGISEAAPVVAFEKIEEEHLIQIKKTP